MASERRSASSRILHNSLWYGLETVIEAVVFLTASVAVARYLGPQKLGYYSYINFFVSVVTRTSGDGLASATRKFMSEFLGTGDIGQARAVYDFAYRYQLVGSIAITGMGLLGVVFFGTPSYKLMASILVISIIPGIMSWVPAQANIAFEDASKNTLSAFGYLASYAVVITLTIIFRWDLIGVASAMFVGRTVEVVLRTRSLHSRLRALPLGALDRPTSKRIRDYCLQSIGIQLLTTIVWDRSEMIFLKMYSSLQQIAFYSISFSLANNLLSIPRTFAGAAGMTLMVESSRDRARANSIVRNTLRYTLFMVIPLHLGALAVTGRAIALAYGVKYIGAIPVMMIAAALSMPRASEELPGVLLRAADKQKQIIYLLTATGILNIALDAAFIPRHGAIGAAFANGLAQAFGVVVIWFAAWKIYRFHFPWFAAFKVLAAAAPMSALAYLIVRDVSGLPGLVLAIVAAVASYVFLVRLFHALEGTDKHRFLLIGNRLPRSMRRGFAAFIAFAVPAAAEIDAL